MEIDYDRCNVSRRLQSEIVNAQGAPFWSELSQCIVVPSDDMDWTEASLCMKAFMDKLQAILSPEEIGAILVKVRHDLSRRDFDWAVRMYREIGDLDRFADALQKKSIGEMVASLNGQEAYFGQAVNREVMEYVNSCEDIFYGRRHGRVILAQAVPANVSGYLHARDEKQRRYCLCHCQFARESILQEEGPVSPLLCNCSLGHTMALWEAVLDQELDGEVVESALMGSDRCLFRIHLP